MAVKKFKPTTPARRQMSVASFDEITKTKPEKSLVKSLNKHSGRNNSGKITVRHRGGGNKRKYRTIDFKRTEKTNIEGKVSSVEYDPNRTGYIMLVVYKDGNKRYHLAPEGIKVGDKIMTTEKAKINTSKANLKIISKWLAVESTSVCSAKQGAYKNGMFFEDGNYQTFIKCSDDGTALAYAASHYFHKNAIFKNPYTGENAIPDKAISSSFNITRGGLKTVSSSYVSKGEIMF